MNARIPDLIDGRAPPDWADTHARWFKVKHDPRMHPRMWVSFFSLAHWNELKLTLTCASHYEFLEIPLRFGWIIRDHMVDPIFIAFDHRTFGPRVERIDPRVRSSER